MQSAVLPCSEKLPIICRFGIKKIFEKFFKKGLTLSIYFAIIGNVPKRTRYARVAESADAHV